MHETCAPSRQLKVPACIESYTSIKCSLCCLLYSFICVIRRAQRKKERRKVKITSSLYLVPF
ncbi:hypothetical protein LEMLEM_LOCUS8082 [Lemmus lemmus]